MADKKSNAQKPIQNLADFMGWVAELEGELLLYRGLVRSGYPVISSAERRCREFSVVPEYTDELLKRARRKRLHNRAGEKLTDLELLAELQHNGAATCLIDFSENPLVALWFACQSDQKKSDGKVIAMRTDNNDNVRFKIIDDENVVEEIIKDGNVNDEIVDGNVSDKMEKLFGVRMLWKWTPWHQNNRIIAQQSVFVFGAESINESDYVSVEILSNAKQEILEELRKKFGINEEYLFSDLSGFAGANAPNKSYYQESVEVVLKTALEHQQRGERTLAIKYYDKVIELESENMGAYYNRGIAKDDSGDWQGAIADYDRAIALDPKNENIYYNRGKSKRAIGDLQGALADYDQAIKLGPKDADAYNNRGNVKFELRDLQGALADYDQAINLNPENAHAYNNRGNVKKTAGDLPGAILDFDKAIELHSLFAEAYSNRGVVKYLSGDTQGAIVDLNIAIRFNPKNSHAYYNRGIAKQIADDWQGAVLDFTQAIELGLKNVGVYYNRGFAKQKIDDLHGAIADYDKVIELDSKFAKAYVNRGLAKLKLGNVAEAQADFARAYELNPSLRPKDK